MGGLVSSAHANGGYPLLTTKEIIMKGGHRKHVPHRKSKKMFRKTASKVNKRNMRSAPMRGGYRI